MSQPRAPLRVAFLMQESMMGGVEFNALHLAGGLDRRRFELTFFCPGDGKLPGLLRQKGLSCVYYKKPPFLSTSFRVGARLIFNPFAALYDLLCFFPLALQLACLLRGGFDLVVTKGLVMNFYGGAAARLAGIPCVWDMQDIVSAQSGLGLFSLLLDCGSWLADHLIAPSEAIKSQFSSGKAEKIVIVPNGVDTERYRPGLDASAVRAEWGVKPEEILIGHVARFTHMKGQMDFIEAAAAVAAALPTARFAIVGSPVFDGDGYEKDMRRRVQELGLGERMLFPGFRDDLDGVLAALDIFVHCSVLPEGCPLTLITAMSMGKPTVATDVPGNNEIVSDAGQARLVAARAPSSLAAAILDLAGSRAAALRMGEEARRRILARYSLRAYVENSEKALARFGEDAGRGR